MQIIINRKIKEPLIFGNFKTVKDLLTGVSRSKDMREVEFIIITVVSTRFIQLFGTVERKYDPKKESIINYMDSVWNRYGIRSKAIRLTLLKYIPDKLKNTLRYNDLIEKVNSRSF